MQPAMVILICMIISSSISVFLYRLTVKKKIKESDSFIKELKFDIDGLEKDNRQYFNDARKYREIRSKRDLRPDDIVAPIPEGSIREFYELMGDGNKLNPLDLYNLWEFVQNRLKDVPNISNENYKWKIMKTDIMRPKVVGRLKIEGDDE